MSRPSGSGAKVDDTWAGREMPVLTAVVTLLSNSYMVTVSDIAEHTGLGMADVARSLDALDPAYLDFRKTETGGDPRFWYVLKVTAEARRAVGQWPTAEGLIDQLVKALNDAGDAAEDAEKHDQLRQASGLLSGAARDVAVKAAQRIIGPPPGRPGT